MYDDTRLIDNFQDLDGFIAELKTPWKTMGEDMDKALTIITNHARTEFDLGVITLRLDDDDLDVEFPAWQDEIEKHFINRYGLKQGKLIFNKVLMRLFQMSKGAAQQLH